MVTIPIADGAELFLCELTLALMVINKILCHHICQASTIAESATQGVEYSTSATGGAIWSLYFLCHNFCLV